MIALQDGRYLMIYGYRRPPYGTRGCISEDGVTWDAKNEFVIREGGVPGASEADRPGSSRMSPWSGKYGSGAIDWAQPGRLPAHRLSERGAAAGRDDPGLLPRVERGRAAAAVRALHPVPARRLARMRPAADAEHRVVLRDEHGYLAHPHLIRAGNELLLVCNWAPRRPFVLHPPEDPLYLNLLLRSADEGRTWSAPDGGAGLWLERGRMRRPDRSRPRARAA